MIVDSKNVEFGYELLAVLPHAYWRHKHGVLTGTRSGTGSEPFYWFSPSHTINPERRDFKYTEKAAEDIPGMWIHKSNWQIQGWEPPPLKEHFLPRKITFEKPTVVICNRYNNEFERGPTNYFDLPTLDKLFKMLCPLYSVVYVNIRGREELEDYNHSEDLGDHDFLRAYHPEVKIIHDLVDEHGGDFNDVQCRVFAGCEKFITMNGGHSILASYFGGENIIYTLKCQELRPNVNSFYNRYQALGGSHIRVVQSWSILIRKVKQAWVTKAPLLNILLRCHNRPNGLMRLWDVVHQSSANIRVIASYDNHETFKYLCEYPFEKYKVEPMAEPAPHGGSRDEYRAFFPANDYLNTLASKVQHGYILYMDDDDRYFHGALERIAEEVEYDKLLLWKVQNRAFTIPQEIGEVKPGSVSTIGFAFHHSMLPAINWEPWRRGDYRVVKKLASLLSHKWLDEVFTEVGKPIDTTNAPRGRRPSTPTTEEF